MYNRSWNKLIKSNDNCKYELKPSAEKEYCTARLSFAQLAFDHDEEYLVVVDIKGSLYCIDLSEDAPLYKRLGKIGQATFLAFNPRYRGEVLVGCNVGDIKIWKLHTNLDEFSLLSGHKLPPTHVSFYKSHCLTHSRNEVIIWYLQSYSKTHQLKVDAKNAVIKKAIFSNAGHIAVLYNNDTMQAWTFKQLDKDTKIDTKIFGTHYIKDFVFTKDGRAMIMIGAKGICILNTYDWSLLKKLSLLDNFVKVRQLSVIPRPLDGGANKIVALLSSRCTLHFCDINLSNLLEISDAINRVKKFVVSSAGRYIAYINQEGYLNIMHIDKVISEKRSQPKKLLELDRPQTHKISDHLECVRQSMRQELDIKRLISILTEFGEYPKQYRALIWSTILKFPANRNAYLVLASKVTRGGFTWNTLKDYSVADKSKASLLTMTINCLLQWCPLLVQSPFLPNLVFPFLTVFQKDPLLAFELILSILLNYCHNWFEYHPLPPLNILGIIENILLEADPQLLNIFCEHGVTTSEYAWPLLQTAMSEVLSGDEWLILWDHLITFQKPRLLLMCVVAYSIYSRENIISLIQSSGSYRRDIKEFYSTQGHVRAKDLLKIARKLDKEEGVRSCRYLRSKLLYLNHTGPYPLFMLKEYPKFLIEDFHTANLKKCKAGGQHSQDCNHKVAESGRKTDAFVKQIYETRLSEIQKCSQEHNKLYCQYLYKDLDSQPRGTQACIKCKNAKDRTLNFKYTTPKNCEKLQRDVTRLEYEVLSFLDALKSD